VFRYLTCVRYTCLLVLLHMRDWDICSSLCNYSLLVFSIILVPHGQERRHFRLNERIPVPESIEIVSFPFCCRVPGRTIRFPVASQTNIRSSQYWFYRSCFSAFGFSSPSHIFCNNGSAPRENYLYPRIMYKVKCFKPLNPNATICSCDLNSLYMASLGFYRSSTTRAIRNHRLLYALD